VVAIRSVGPPTREHRARSANEDGQVLFDGPVAKILVVDRDHLREVNVAPSRHLPQSGHARSDGRAAGSSRGRNLRRYLQLQRARADETHIADEDVPQLRQLIDAEAAKRSPDS